MLLNGNLCRSCISVYPEAALTVKDCSLRDIELRYCDNVIILKNLEAMPMSFQLRLADVLQSMELTRRVKFISTVSGPLKSLIPSKQLSIIRN